MAVAIPGWYYTDGDPPGTMRYWDGTTWVGGPTATPTATPPVIATQPASPGRRAAATVLDLLVWATLVAPLWFVAAWLWVIENHGLTDTGEGPEPFRRPDHLLTAHIVLFVCLGLAMRLTGTTPGKALTGLRIVTETGERPGSTHVVRRIAPLAVWFVPAIGGRLLLLLHVASIVMASTPDGRSVFDRVSDTKVVRS